MKYEDLGEVMGFKKILEKLIEALGQAKELQGLYNGDNDYWCRVCKNRDGSGLSIKLEGCYIGDKVTKAVSDLIVEEIKITKTELESLGVVFEEEVKGNEIQ